MSWLGPSCQILRGGGVARYPRVCIAWLLQLPGRLHTISGLVVRVCFVSGAGPSFLLHARDWGPQSPLIWGFPWPSQACDAFSEHSTGEVIQCCLSVVSLAHLLCVCVCGIFWAEVSIEHFGKVHA